MKIQLTFKKNATNQYFFFMLVISIIYNMSINEVISIVLGILYIFMYVIILGYYIICVIRDSIVNKVNNNKRNYDDEEYEWQDKKLKTN